MNNDKPTRIDKHGTKFWEVNGNLHRENGPARIYADGLKLKKELSTELLNNSNLEKKKIKI